MIHILNGIIFENKLNQEINDMEMKCHLVQAEAEFGLSRSEVFPPVSY